jgi:hypothetical protein
MEEEFITQKILKIFIMDNGFTVSKMGRAWNITKMVQLMLEILQME